MAIGFVIWGLRYNDFSSDLLSAGLVSDVLGVLSDQMRQVCSTQQRSFLTVQRSDGHLLTSIFKPDALDHVGRRAYIGITVFVPLGQRHQARSGTVPEAMHKLLAYYEEKQGRVVERNQFTAEMFQAQVDGLLEAIDGIQIRSQGQKRGYAVYSAQQEAEWFQGMDLGDYRRVFFFREVPEMEAAGLTGYEPFDPNKKVEEVRAEEHVYDGRMPPRKRRAHTGWTIAIVLGLSLLVIAGGALWVLLNNETATEADAGDVRRLEEPIVSVPDSASMPASLELPQDKSTVVIDNSAPKSDSGIVEDPLKDKKDPKEFDFCKKLDELKISLSKLNYEKDTTEVKRIKKEIAKCEMRCHEK